METVVRSDTGLEKELDKWYRSILGRKPSSTRAFNQQMELILNKILVVDKNIFTVYNVLTKTANENTIPDDSVALTERILNYLFHWLGQGFYFYINNEDMVPFLLFDMKQKLIRDNLDNGGLYYVIRKGLIDLYYYFDFTRIFTYRLNAVKEMLLCSKNIQKIMRENIGTGYNKIDLFSRFFPNMFEHMVDSVIIRALELYELFNGITIRGVVSALNETINCDYFPRLYINQGRKVKSYLGRMCPYLELKLTLEEIKHNSDLYKFTVCLRIDNANQLDEYLSEMSNPKT